MIKNKHISKITMLTCLMLGGIVNAQEFYTCVPKKSWYNNGNNFPNVNELAEAIAKGIKETNKKEWKLVFTYRNSNADFWIGEGNYKFIYYDKSKYNELEFSLPYKQHMRVYTNSVIISDMNWTVIEYYDRNKPLKLYKKM